MTSKKNTWETLNVPDDIKKGLIELNHTNPSIIQSASMPTIQNNQTTNYFFQSPNGSGKTGAFLVPSLLRVDRTNPKIQVLILAHTKDLIDQITDVAKKMAKFSPIKISMSYGGVDT